MRREHARILLPSPALAGCIFMAVERDTRGVSLDAADRYNRYPATPFPVVSWTLAGDLHLVEGDEVPPGGPGDALPTVLLSGPHRQPATTWSPGPVHVLAVAIAPDAMATLVGVRPDEILDAVVPLRRLAGQPLVDRLLAIDTAADDPFDEIQGVLSAAWTQSTPTAARPSVRDWMSTTVDRAAGSHRESSVRQAQRRIKEWTGQSHRDLRPYARLEEALARTTDPSPSGRTGLADVAHAAGYADQSHFGREVRRGTGLTPARFEERITDDESFWFYRLLRAHLGSA